MKLTIFSMSLTLLLFSQPTLAENMECPGGIIQGDLPDPVTIGQVKSKCGGPDSRDGETWIYKKGMFEYRLQFSSNGELRSMDKRRKE